MPRSCIYVKNKVQKRTYSVLPPSAENLSVQIHVCTHKSILGKMNMKLENTGVLGRNQMNGGDRKTTHGKPCIH